jgi:hypothetical protein
MHKLEEDSQLLATHLANYVTHSHPLHSFHAPESSPASRAVDSWPDLPVTDLWTLDHILLASAEDHLRLLSIALYTSSVSVAALTVGRAAQENAARAYWLIEPGLPLQTHVARHYALLLTDLTHKLRAMQGVDDEGHANVSRTLTTVIEHAREAGFQVNKVTRRIEVNGERAPDSRRLALIGLLEEDQGAGSYQFSLSSSIAHGSGLGVMELCDVTDWDRFSLVLRLTSGDAAVAVSAGVLAHGLAYRELSRLFGFQPPREWSSARAELLTLVSKFLVQAARNVR